MALLTINRHPSSREIAWFGAMLAAFFVFLGVVVYFWTGSTRPLVVLATIGGAIALLYYALSPLRRPMYLAWVYLTFPIGFVVSHLVLGIVYFLVLTPIGFVMRAFGRDALQLRADANATSYWMPRKRAESARYFRQF